MCLSQLSQELQKKLAQQTLIKPGVKMIFGLWSRSLSLFVFATCVCWTKVTAPHHTCDMREYLDTTRPKSPARHKLSRPARPQLPFIPSSIAAWQDPADMDLYLIWGVYSSRRPNTFPQRTPILFPTRDPYFSVKWPKTIKKGQYYAYLDLIQMIKAILGHIQALNSQFLAKNSPKSPIFFPTRDPYFSVKWPKTIKKRIILCIFRPYLDD